MEQVVQLETRFNAISLPMDPPSAANGGVSDAAGHDEGADDRDGVGAKENGRPLARRVKASLQPFLKVLLVLPRQACDLFLHSPVAGGRICNDRARVRCTSMVDLGYSNPRCCTAVTALAYYLGPYCYW